MAKKWPGMVVQRTFIKGHSFVYRLYIPAVEDPTKKEYPVLYEEIRCISKLEVCLATLHFKRKPYNCKKNPLPSFQDFKAAKQFVMAQPLF